MQTRKITKLDLNKQLPVEDRVTRLLGAMTLQEKIGQMSEEDFAGIMRPIFQKDEWKLVALGAVLGLGIGLFQLYYVWGGTL